MVTPGFAIAIHVGDASLLHDRIDAAARVEECVEHVAGADPIRLARGLRHDASVRGTVDGRELSQIIEAGMKLARGHQRLLPVTRNRPQGNLGSSGSVGSL